MSSRRDTSPEYHEDEESPKIIVILRTRSGSREGEDMIPYKVIYADPPWQWAARSPKGEGRSAKNHYQVMTLQDIKDLPVASIAAPSSVLLMWVIDPMIPQALEVMDSWGFEFKTVAF